MKIHLDTDLGGDLDDLCALAMLLRWPEPNAITGITVVGDAGGRRTGMVRRVLEIAGRSEIPVAAGAETSGGYYPYDLGLPDETRYWEIPIAPSPNPARDAVDLLMKSIELGATIIGIGPYTNLRLLEDEYPGSLARVPLVLMGGYFSSPPPGYPEWANADDFNVQVDVESSSRVLRASSPTFVTLASTVQTALRSSHLDRLGDGDALARLIARQAEAFAVDERMDTRFGATCAQVPDDIINFQHDALACAVALGWDEGIEIEDVFFTPEIANGVLIERIETDGRAARVVTKVAGARFSEFWLETITRP